jgi:uncharacterized membrane protein
MFGLNWKPLSEFEEKQVVDAIAEAEKQTSGEIRVHIDKWCKTDPIYKAQNLFNSLGLEETALRNGVLIYVAAQEHKFAIIGDVGINHVVPRNFWESTKDEMKEEFKKGNLAGGICAGIKEAGIELKAHFPYSDDDENELPNEISYGK